jgi:hypothetical protein
MGVWFFGIRLLFAGINHLADNKRSRILLGVIVWAVIGLFLTGILYLLFPDNGIWKLLLVVGFAAGLSKILESVNTNIGMAIIVAWIVFFLGMPIYYLLTLKGL